MKKWDKINEEINFLEESISTLKSQSDTVQI